MEEPMCTSYLSVDLKNITDKLIKSSDLTWFCKLLLNSSPIQIVHLSEPLTECFKNPRIRKKIGTTKNLERLILDALHSNCLRVSSKMNDISIEEVQLLSVCCLGIQLFLKSKINLELESDFFHLLSKGMTQFLCHADFICRNSMLLIMSLVITINIEFCQSSIKKEFNWGIDHFPRKKNGSYFVSAWINCIAKTCECSETDRKGQILDCIEHLILNELLKSEKMIWLHYLHLDTIRTWLKKYPKNFQGESRILERIFCCSELYYDAKGFNTEKVCEEIQSMCLNLHPSLIHRVEALCLGPWYSRNTMHYQNTLLNFQCDNESHLKILQRLISRLGYNRLDHVNLKVIKTFLQRQLSKDNYLGLLMTTVEGIKQRRSITRQMCLYIAPLFRDATLFPTDIETIIIGILSAPAISDCELVYLFEVFFSVFKDATKPLLLSTQLNKSHSSDVQSALILLISRSISDFADSDFILDTYKQLLSIPCPTVRQHIVASFSKLQNLAKSNELLFKRLAVMFMKNINMDTPYHPLLTSLKFLSAIFNQKLDYLLDESESYLLSQDLLQLIHNHSDSEVVSAASSVMKHFSSADCILEGIRELNTSSDPVDELIADMSLIQDVQDVVVSDVPSEIASLVSKVNHVSLELIPLTDACNGLLSRLLDMTSPDKDKSTEDAQSYSAASFEEIFVTIQSRLEESCKESSEGTGVTNGVNEEFCKTVGKHIWDGIATTLQLLDQLVAQLVDQTMKFYLEGNEGECKEYVQRLSAIGQSCLSCIFRCRHRSVINAACNTLRTVSILTHTHTPTFHLSGNWLQVLLRGLCTDSTGSSLSRRSGGLPEATEAVLQCNDFTLTHTTVSTLIQLANQPYPNEDGVSTETQDLSQVHSLHVLRLVISSAKLRLHVLQFTDQICELCYTGFVHKYWVVRNASFLLFVELVNFILGHKNTEYDCGYRSSLSIRELKHHHPGIFRQVLDNLSIRTSSTSTLSCPTLFLSLMIASKLYPDPLPCVSEYGNQIDDAAVGGNDVGEVDEEVGDVFGKYIFRLLSSPLFKLRSVAARTLPLVSPLPALHRYVTECSSSTMLSCRGNQLHGILMFLLEYCKMYPSDFVNYFTSIEILRGKLENGEFLTINGTLILQIFIALRKSNLISLNLNVKIPDKDYPSEIKDYLGIWHIENGEHGMAFLLIQKHYLQLTEIFWNNLNTEFYNFVSPDNIIWLLQELPSSQYKCRSLVKCAFHALNCRQIENLCIPSNIVQYLSENIVRYRALCVLLSLTYNVGVTESDESVLTPSDKELSFDQCNIDYLLQIFSIRKCNYNTPLFARVLCAAQLHVQSEDEDLRTRAIEFCMTHCCDDVRSHGVTPRYALECVREFMRHNTSRNVFVAAVNDIRTKVLSGDYSGFSSQFNAHFDRRVFLDLTDLTS